jgi:Ribonuclease G/E
VAIDVDAGPRSGKQQNAAKFCEDLNCAAAEVLARAVRLKGLGGLFAVDFAALTDVKTRAKVETVLKASLKVDPAETRCGTIDQFGVCIFQRQRKTRSVLELLLEPGQSGRDPAVLSVESRSLEAIRQLETQAYTDRGARLVLRVPNDVHAWLNADTIGWKTALAAKIGARFVVQPALSVGQRVDVEMQ